MYELHIAIPQVSPAIMMLLFARLAQVGFEKNKFFYRVANIRPTGTSCHPSGTPPTGHDLRDPGAMSTLKVASYEEARRFILIGMEVLSSQGIRGNFEIEGLLGPTTLEFPAIHVATEFPGFRQTPDSPSFENHIIWKGPASALPGLGQIVRYSREEIGVVPHQIVDFGRDPVMTDETTISRVMTVYQPSCEATLQFAERLRGVKNTLGYRYAVAEQVMAVGEAL